MEIDSTDIKPAFIPIKCPVCNGFGTVNWGKVTCHGCKGNGYVLVPVEMKDRQKDNDKP